MASSNSISPFFFFLSCVFSSAKEEQLVGLKFAPRQVEKFQKSVNETLTDHHSHRDQLTIGFWMNGCRFRFFLFEKLILIELFLFLFESWHLGDLGCWSGGLNAMLLSILRMASGTAPMFVVLTSLNVLGFVGVLNISERNGLLGAKHVVQNAAYVLSGLLEIIILGLRPVTKVSTGSLVDLFIGLFFLFQFFFRSGLKRLIGATGVPLHDRFIVELFLFLPSPSSISLFFFLILSPTLLLSQLLQRSLTRPKCYPATFSVFIFSF